MLSNRLKVSDTASMLNGYTKTGQSMKYADTASMLSGYARTGQSVQYSDTALMLSNRLKVSDTASMLSGYARNGQSMKYADTALMLSGYAKTGLSVQYADTAAMLQVKAPLISPAFTGSPTAPTAAAGTNNTQLATTAYADAAVAAATPAGSSLTGSSLAANITTSLLTSLGTLNALSVSGTAAVTGTITTDGGLNASASPSSAGIGYSSNGAVVAQTNNKSKSVTINAYSGRITTDNARLNVDSNVSFVVNNSVVKDKDVPFVAIASGGGTGRYQVQVDAVTNGSFTITLYNTSGANVSDNLVLNFIIFRGN
ncbi:MAG: hypothetical protein HYU71_06125 [Bacteroidetes bacterium]|nr:hypothetical protein [Bacteroidota bacterium]